MKLAKKLRKPRGRCVAGKCGSGALCFVAGTLVAATAGAVPIEDVQVGDRVRTHQGASTTEVDETWRVLQLELTNPAATSDVIEITLLRSPQWLRARGVARVGDAVFITKKELSVEGWAEVVAIGPAPTPRDGPGRVVLATVTHHNDDVFELTFHGDAPALRPTGQHRLYSLDRGAWVRTRHLRPGERLQTAKGAVQIAALERIRGVHRVFNLEVEGDHEFLVGPAEIRAHNMDCPEPGSKPSPALPKDPYNPAAVDVRRAAAARFYTRTSRRSHVTRAQLPTKGKVRYIPPTEWVATQPLPRGNNRGYLDKFGNEWTKGPSRTKDQPFEWDVQRPDGTHWNISMDGRVTH